MNGVLFFVSLIYGLLLSLSYCSKPNVKVTIHRSYFKQVIDFGDSGRHSQINAIHVNSIKTDWNVIFRVDTDIGPICLAEEGEDEMIHYYISGCVSRGNKVDPLNAHFCPGPKGPATVWTYYMVQNSIIKCLSKVLKDGEKFENFSEDELKEFLKAKPKSINSMVLDMALAHKNRQANKETNFGEKMLEIELDDPRRSIVKALRNESGLNVDIVLVTPTNGIKNSNIVMAQVKNAIPQTGVICFIPSSMEKKVNKEEHGCKHLITLDSPKEMMSLSQEDLRAEVLIFLGRRARRVGKKLMFQKITREMDDVLDLFDGKYVSYDSQNSHEEL